MLFYKIVLEDQMCKAGWGFTPSTGGRAPMKVILRCGSIVQERSRTVRVRIQKTKAACEAISGLKPSRLKSPLPPSTWGHPGRPSHISPSSALMDFYGWWEGVSA